MSPSIKKSHNVSELIYHFVCPVKYRRKVFTSENEITLKNICLELEKRHELYFIEIGIDSDHVHFLVPSVPNISPSALANTIKGNTSIQMFKEHPEVKTFLWGGNFWSRGYYVNTVGNANMKTIKNYVKNQGIPNYKQLHSVQPTLFPSQS